MLKTFRASAIRFYTLILKDAELEEISSYGESLGDFLEYRVCTILNLPKDREYFLCYAPSQSFTAYHCILIDKESLKDYVKSAESYLSHPCFFCTQFLHAGLEYQCFLVLDEFLEFTYVLYHKGEIIAVQYLGRDFNLEALEPLTQEYGITEIYFWEAQETKANVLATLERVKQKFTLHSITRHLESVELVESYNFNPLEKTIPFLCRRSGIALKMFGVGISIGALLWVIMTAIMFLQGRENLDLQGRVSALKLELDTLAQNRTNTQKEMFAMQEKLESLTTIHQNNAALLKDSAHLNPQPATWIDTLSPYLEKHRVKIVYFALDNDVLSLLLLGGNSLKILELLEKESLGLIQAMETYGVFTWVEILNLKESYGDS